jgi:PilZ domain
MRSLLGYLVLDQPRQRYTHWMEALAPLGAVGAPLPLDVDAYFVAAEDRALLGLWYLGGDTEAFELVAEVTRLAEIYVIDPGCLSEPDRRVLQERLAECEVIVEDQPTIAEAFTELVKRARDLRGLSVVKSSRTITGRAVTPLAVPVPAVEPPRVERPALTRDRVAHGSVVSTAEARAERSTLTRDRVMPSAPGGDPDGLVGGARARSPGTDRVMPSAQGGDPDGLAGGARARSPGIDRLAAAALAHPEARSRTSSRDSASLLPSMPAAEAPRAGRPAGTRDNVKMPPAAIGAAPAVGSARQPAGAAHGEAVSDGGSTGYTRSSRPRNRSPESATDPFLLAFEATTPSIGAQMLRGQRFVPAQLSQLSLEGAQLATVALPRLGDTVFLAITFGEVSASVHGEVTYLSDESEVAHSGAAQFHVKFSLDDPQQDRLYSLLLRARQANAQLRQPPRRAQRRVAVSWPVMLATPRGSIRAEAFDVSERGLFAHPLRELMLEGNIGFSTVLDDQVTSVSGRCQVVRQVEAVEAKQRGMRAGYGMEITELSEPDRLAWERFVVRVRRRGGKRVLVGAPAARFEEISSSLVAVGYSVTGGVDLATVAQLIEAEKRPADAAILDADWAQAGPADPRGGWLEVLLGARGVPCLATHGDGRRAYGEVDRLLGIT